MTICSNCKRMAPVQWCSFQHKDALVCLRCENEIRQSIEDSVRSELGMDPEDIVTLG